MNQTRKILLCVSGMSPQIVTETLYALVTEKNWIPDEIRVLSTKEGCDRAKAELLHESRNMFGKFCDDYLPQGPRPRFDENSFVTFSRSSEPSGNPVALNDIVDLEDSAQVADTIAKEVFELTKDENTEIHASIAGGRKSMGFLLGYAMSLYGRPQDRLSHVLITADFESSRDFYFPPKKPIIVHGRENKPLNTENAKVMLAEIPILHLRHRLPKDMQKKSASFADLIAVMNRSMEEASIELRLACKQVKCHGIDIELSNSNFAFYYLVAKKTKEEGFFDMDSLTRDECIFLKEYGHDAVYCSENKLEYEAIDLFEDKNKNRESFFRDRRNQIKTALNDRLGIVAKIYEVRSKKSKNFIAVDSVDEDLIVFCD